jgi:ABC-type transport system involved in cytochrome c biogenesis permease subunit
MTDTSHITVLPLNISAFIYLASCVFFFVAVARAGAKTQSKASVIAEFLAVGGVVFHTVGLAGRWYVGGIDRPPWTNLYESLVGFAWMLAVFQVLAFRKNKVPLVGAFSMPLVFLLMGMSVMTPNKAVEPLVPALQSYWLKIHVIFGMLSYAAFTMAACFALLQLIKSKISFSKIGGGMCLMMLLNLGIAGGTEIVTQGQFLMAKTVLRKMPDGTEKYVKDTYREDPSVSNSPVITRMEVVPYANIGFFAAAASFLFGAFYFFGRKSGRGSGNDLDRVGRSIMWAGTASVLGLFAAIWWGLHNSPTLTLGSNPYLVMLLVMSFFELMIFMVISMKYDGFLSALPSADRLDELSYKNILFGVPFQSLLLVTGAIWAYAAWGRSWGWDPKETGALITWIVYLIYLHGKLLLNWKPSILAVTALIGFAVMVFAFLGVNLVLSGLHSYGAA